MATEAKQVLLPAWTETRPFVICTYCYNPEPYLLIGRRTGCHVCRGTGRIYDVAPVIIPQDVKDATEAAYTEIEFDAMVNAWAELDDIARMDAQHLVDVVLI